MSIATRSLAFVASIVVAGVIALTGAAPAAAQTDPAAAQAKAARAKTVSEFLGREGYSPDIDADGDVRFRFQGGTYYVMLDADRQFFRLVFPNFWKIESPAERERARTALDVTNARVKVTKVYFYRDNVWAAVELFFPDADRDFQPVLQRSLTALQNGVRQFAQEMQAPR